MTENPFIDGMAVLSQAAEVGTNDPIQATVLAYQALRLFESVPTRRGQAAAHQLIGNLAAFTEDLSEARDHLTAAVNLFEDCELDLAQAEALADLGRLGVRIGDLDGAIRCFEKGRDLIGNIGPNNENEEFRLLGRLYRELGSAHRRLGNLLEADNYYLHAEQSFYAGEDNHGSASVLLSRGNLLMTMDLPEQAARAYHEASVRFMQSDDPLGEANANRFLATARLKLGEPEVALRELEWALHRYTEIGEPLGEAHTRSLIALINGAYLQALYEAGENGDAIREQAIEHATRAVQLFGRMGEGAEALDAAEALAETLIATGERVAALRILAEALAEARSAARVSIQSLTGDDRADEALARRLAEVELAALQLALEGNPHQHAPEVMQIIEDAESGLGGLLHLLLDGPESDDPRVTGLRAELRELTQRLAADRDDPSTDDGAADAPKSLRITSRLEQLLGKRAAQVLHPPRVDCREIVETLTRDHFVLQCTCPQGLVEGAPVAMVWAGPGSAPRNHYIVLDAQSAEQLRILTGADLPPDADEDAVQESTRAMWRLLDQDATRNTLFQHLKYPWFPMGFADALAAAVDPETGIPPRLLIIPGAHLWNLPWGALIPTKTDNRLAELARISLSPSLGGLRDQERWLRSVDLPEQSAASRNHRSATAWIPTETAESVSGVEVERTTVATVYGKSALAKTTEEFLSGLAQSDLGIASVHGRLPDGLGHSILLKPGRTLSAADLLTLDLGTKTLIIGACFSSRIPTGTTEPFALSLIAHARGVSHVIGGIFPLPDAPPFPTARLLSQLYTALRATDPATALWLAQHEAIAAGAAPHTWAGLIHSTISP